MKFKDLDNRIIAKDISKYKREGNKSNASKGEITLGEKLDELFPGTIYQELPCFGTKLRLDFYIHLLRTAFEFDGNQHDKFIPHFHKSRRKFHEAKNRDWQKEQWCEINNIRLIRLKSKDLDNLESIIIEH